MKKAILTAVLLVTVCLAVAGCAKSTPSYTLTGTVNDIGNHIDFTVIENSYASGIFWAITDSQTVYVFDDGEAAERTDITAGVEITVEYSGQIMMSYPGQIYAKKVIIHK